MQPTKKWCQKIDHARRNTDLFEVAAHLGERKFEDRRQQTQPCSAHLSYLLTRANKLLQIARCSQKPSPENPHQAQWLYPKRSDIMHRPMPHSIIIRMALNKTPRSTRTLNLEWRRWKAMQKRGNALANRCATRACPRNDHDRRSGSPTAS